MTLLDHLALEGQAWKSSQGKTGGSLKLGYLLTAKATICKRPLLHPPITPFTGIKLFP